MTWSTMWTMCRKRTSEDVGNGSPVHYRENKLRIRNYNCTYMVCTTRIYIQRCRDLPFTETAAKCMSRRCSWCMEHAMKFWETLQTEDGTTGQGGGMPVNRPEFQCYPHSWLYCNSVPTWGPHVRRSENAASYEKGNHNHLGQGTIVIGHGKPDFWLQFQM